MIDFRYTFNLNERDEDQLAEELRALNIDTPLTIFGSAGVLQVKAERALTGSEYDAVAHAVNTHIPDAEFAAKREINNAVATLLHSPDAAVRGQVNVTRVLATRLNDATQLLAKVVAWMRAQPGSPALTDAEVEITNAFTLVPRLTEKQIVDAASEIMFLEQTGQLEQPPSPSPMPPNNG